MDPPVKTVPIKLSLDFLSAQDLYRDPRLLTMKDKLLQDYYRYTQTARPPPPGDSVVLKVPSPQLRRLLNALSFANRQKEQRLRELKSVCASMAKSVECAVTQDTLNFNHSILTQDSAGLPGKPTEGDPVSLIHGLLRATEEKIESEEFTKSQLKHLVEQTTQNIVKER